MKRGRPSKRFEIYRLIEEYFKENPFPSNINRILRYIYEKTERKYSWNTIKKYLEELTKLDRIKKIKLPHSKIKEKEGLTLYYLEVKNE
ncbi:MAG: hypothetical protein QXW35_01315 [Candidatus Aenigmatarchaeota archaeon]|nr:hypothetical protein [Candidatus Aenigmarchaeota archaeon]